MSAPVEAVTAVPPIDASARVANPTSASAGPSAHGHDATPAPSAAPATPAPGSPTRLLVEAGKGIAPFVYKIVDRSTGRVLSEIPREAAESLAAKTSYAAGTVVDESA